MENWTQRLIATCKSLCRGKNARKARRKATRVTMFEAFEPRRVLTNYTVQLSSLDPTEYLTSSITAANRSDDYRVTLDSEAPLRVNLSGMTGNLDVQVLGRGGTVLASGSLLGNNIEDVITAVLPFGDYSVRVTPVGNVNSSYQITLGIDPVSDDFIKGASDLGTLSTNVPAAVVQELIGQFDVQDYFRFRTTAVANTRLVLSGYLQDLNVEVLNSVGTVIFTGAATGSAIENLAIPSLAPGAYFARVFPADNFQVLTAYNLTVGLDRDPDTFITSATNRGAVDLLNPTLVIEDSVNWRTDVQDYHKFTVNQAGQVRANLFGLTDNLDIQILDSTGRILSTGNQSGVNIEDLTVAVSAGDYYVRIAPVGEVSSPYSLILCGNANSDDLLVNAADLEPITTNHPTSFDKAQTAERQNFRRFVTDSTGPIRINLSKLSIASEGEPEPYLDLLDSFGRRIAPSVAVSSGTKEVFVPALNAGVYFVSLGGRTFTYDLIVTRDTSSDDLLTKANDLGTIGDLPFKLSVRASGSLGVSANATIDILDYYKFNLATSSTVRLNLSGLKFPIFQLLDSNGSNVLPSGAILPSGESPKSLLSVRLIPDTYYVRLFSRNYQTELLTYDLAISTIPSDDLISFPTDLGTLTTTTPTLRTENEVGGLDIQDYYQFSLSAPASVLANLSNLNNDLDMELLDVNGFVIDKLRRSGLTMEASTGTNLPIGTYFIHVLPAGALSSTYDLAVSLNPISDDLIVKAPLLGTLATSTRPSLRVQGTVGSADDIQDYVRFVTAATSDVQINLGGITRDLNLQLFDVNGQSKNFAITSKPGTALETYNIAALAKGVYHLRVYPASIGSSTNYDLNVTVDPTLDDVLTTASNALGTLTTGTRPTAVVTGRVGGSADIQDYYRLQFGTSSPLLLNLSGMSSNLNVQILNADGQVLASGINPGQAIESLVVASLPAGAYFIRVFSATATSQSNYRLIVSNLASDDLFSNAVNLSSLGGTKPSGVSSGSVGGIDFQDYFRFSVGSGANLRINLSGIPDTASSTDVELLNSFGNIVASSATSGTQIEDLTVTSLAAGVYYVRVYGSSAVAEKYDLTVSTTPTSDDLIQAAAVLGNLDPANQIKRAVGSVGTILDLQDYYRLTLTSTSDIRINLAGLSDDIDLQLLDANGRPIANGGAGGSTIENTVATNLSAGVYFIRVAPFRINSTSSYELSVSVDLLTDDLITNAVDLGALDSSRPTVRTTGALGAANDQRDYFTFTLSSPSDLRATVNGLTGLVNLVLLDGVGRILSNRGNSALLDLLQTTLPAGTYSVLVLQLGGVTNYELTVSSVPYLDDTLGGAPDIGTLTLATAPSLRLANSTGQASDIQDYFRFSLTAVSNLRLNLSGMTQDLNFEVINSNGFVIDNSVSAGTTIERISLTGVPAGVYYVRIFGAALSDYVLAITTDSLSNDVIGNPSVLGELTSSRPTVQFLDSVGGSDIQDYFSFTISTAGSVRVNLSDLASDIDVEILNSFGLVIASSSAGGTNPENALAANLLVGTYYVRVLPFSGSSSYNITVSADPFSDDQVSGAISLSTLATATKPSAATSGFVGGLADVQDYYSFALASTSNVQVNLSGLSVDVDVQILDSSGHLMSQGIASGTTIENVLINNLAAGNYLIRVFAFSSQSAYDLAVTVNTTSDDVITNASFFGLLNRGATATASNSVGGALDIQDYFSLGLTTTSTIQLSLTGLSSDIDVAILDSTGKIIASSRLSGTRDENISVGGLGVGAYFIIVYPASGISSYNLAMRVV